MQPESLPPQGENDIAPKLCSTDEDHSDRSPMACCKVEPPEMDCQWTLNQMTNVAKQIPHLELHQDKLLLASSLNLAFACQFNRTPDTPSARETTFRGIFINLFHILTCPFNTIMSWLFRAKKPPRKLPNSFAKSMPKLQLCESNWLNAEDLRMPDLHAPLAKSLHGLCRWSHHQRHSQNTSTFKAPDCASNTQFFPGALALLPLLTLKETTPLTTRTTLKVVGSIPHNTCQPVVDCSSCAGDGGDGTSADASARGVAVFLPCWCCW